MVFSKYLKEVESDLVYVNKCTMSHIPNSIPLRKIQKVCRGLRYLAYHMCYGIWPTTCVVSIGPPWGRHLTHLGLEVWSCAAKDYIHYFSWTALVTWLHWLHIVVSIYVFICTLLLAWDWIALKIPIILAKQAHIQAVCIPIWCTETQNWQLYAVTLNSTKSISIHDPWT